MGKKIVYLKRSRFSWDFFEKIYSCKERESPGTMAMK